MKLVKKRNKNDFLEVNDYNTLKIGDIVKIYCQETKKYIKNNYFVVKIHENEIFLQNGNLICVFRTDIEKLI